MTIVEIRERHEMDEVEEYLDANEAHAAHMDRAHLLDLVARMRPWLLAQRNALETFPNGTKHPEFAALDALLEETKG